MTWFPVIRTYVNGIQCWMLLMLIFSFRDVVSQKLVFQKNRYKQVYYQTGDIVTFNVAGSRDKIRAQIIGFRDSVVVFRNFTLAPKEISHMYVDNKTKSWYFLRYKYEKLFLIAGIGYLVLDIVNTGDLDPQTVKISAALVSAGLLAKLLISKRIRINGRRRLMIVG